MSQNGWNEVWNRRNLSISESSTLQTLICLDGFDCGAGRIIENDWKAYSDYICSEIGINPGDSIFEVGCGSGAFLYMLFIKGHTVGGIDYSEPLIHKAQSVFPGMCFTVAEALSLDVKTPFDMVVSNGVYHYFPDFNYAEAVTLKMLLKAKRSIAILEVPDAALKNESENARRGMLPPDEYDKKYKGLEHLYFERSWFEDFARRHKCTCRLFDQNIRGYGNNRYRFNCIMEKIP